jgi:hypothetical protein
MAKNTKPNYTTVPRTSALQGSAKQARLVLTPKVGAHANGNLLVTELKQRLCLIATPGDAGTYSVSAGSQSDRMSIRAIAASRGYLCEDAPQS